MSKKRYIDTKFWDDNYIIHKDPVEKLLFIYFLTNTLTNILGIYEISLRRIAFDTGIDSEMVMKILGKFEKDNKVKYENGWVAIRNFTKHQQINPKIRAGIMALLKEVPKELIYWVNIDYESLSIDYDTLSHLNLNTNTNTNLNSTSDSLSSSIKKNKEKEVNNGKKEKDKDKIPDFGQGSNADLDAWSKWNRKKDKNEKRD